MALNTNTQAYSLSKQIYFLMYRWAGCMLQVLDMSSDAARHITGKLPSGPGSEQITSLRRQAMSNKQEPSRIAVLDDYQNAALSLADWSVVATFRASSYP